MLVVLRRMRKPLVALCVAAGLTGLATADLLETTLVILAPTEVIAGNPILGVVVGMEDMCTISAGTMRPNPEGPPTMTPLGPSIQGEPYSVIFFFPTYEPMAPGVVTITAQDTDEITSKCVFLK